MNKSTLLLLPLASFVIASCGNNNTENYDTPPTQGPTSATAATPAHPTYGEAAYEDTTTTTAPPTTPLPSDPVAATTTPNPAGAQEYYVAPGDSLWKISSKFKVPIASIKAANNMTTDTVVLGKKIIIPAQ